MHGLGSQDFFFQAEDGIRDAQESRGLGDVYKRQVVPHAGYVYSGQTAGFAFRRIEGKRPSRAVLLGLSLIHI